jgi:hypothetical protein
MEKSLYTRATLHPLALGLVAAGLGVGVLSYFMQKETTTQRYRRHLRNLGRRIPQLPQKLHDLRQTFH